MSWMRLVFTKYHGGLIVSAILLISLKAVLLLTESITFDSDEAVIGLMAKHILRGEFPLFFYGQAYMGSLDAILVAISFLIFGQTVEAIRLTQIALSLGVLVTSYTLAFRLTQRDARDFPDYLPHIAGTVTSLLLALPPVLYSLYTTATLGNYVETLLLNNVIWLLGLDVLIGKKEHRAWWFTLGLLAGIGWWSMALIIVSVAPLVIIGLWRYRRRIPVSQVAMLIAGFLLGALPWIIGTINLGTTETVGDVLGRFVSGGQGDGLGEVASRVVNLFIFNVPAIMGLRPPWALDWIILPLGIGVSVVYLIVCWRAFRRGWNTDETSYVRYALWCYVGGLLLLPILFIGSPFGRDITGRYFLPVIPILAVLIGNFSARALAGEEVGTGWWRFALPAIWVCALVAYNLSGTIRSIQTNPPGLTTQFDPISHIPHDHDEALLDFLASIDINRGYSNYWLTYRLAFSTDEQLILLPRLPYKADLSYTSDDNRYEPYNSIVSESETVAYITSNHPELNQRLRFRFEELGITHAEQTIGPYTIFYDFPYHVTPEELGAFGPTSDPSF